MAARRGGVRGIAGGLSKNPSKEPDPALAGLPTPLRATLSPADAFKALVSIEGLCPVSVWHSIEEFPIRHTIPTL
jgi:hypothetical protein